MTMALSGVSTPWSCRLQSERGEEQSPGTTQIQEIHHQHHTQHPAISQALRLNLIQTTFLHSLVISFPPKSNYLIKFTLSKFLKSNKYRWGRSSRSQIGMHDCFSNFALKTQRKFVFTVLCFPSSQRSIRRCG